MHRSKAFCLVLLFVLLWAPSGIADGQSSGGQLIGVWNATEVVPGGARVASQIILQSSGSYTKQDRNLRTGFMTTITGNYEVHPAQRLLRLNIQHGEPAKTCGPLGCNPIRYPAAETYTYSFIDANNLQLHFIYCSPGKCTYVYRRVV